ncbi:asparagine synthase [Rhizophagus clarus]|uniref:asparagine synthase (glutamine-hydrolyzing) n=1 Tax=Rhizophagus clarus TaxID=94130 RepID=A0A8H3M5W7_9GLOM|nr:asparagine synthase [Rhizophagus clarus]
MCGIFAVFNYPDDIHAFRRRALLLSKKLRHRGPDWSGCKISGNNILCHERLAIVGVDSGAQPLTNEDGSIILAVNGEIYNHKALKKQLRSGVTFKTQSDCEVILHLYSEIGKDVVNHLDGLPPWWDGEIIPKNPINYTILRETLEKAVRKRLMSDVPYGVLLSGGLDSSLIASIATREAAKLAANGYQEDSDERENTRSGGVNGLHSFSIGLPGSPDLVAARSVAEFLNTIHHEYTFTIQEGLDAVHDIIHHLETYDVTTIRASTPMYLLSRKIKAMGVKMVLSGEGSDEILGGYLYFHAAPSAADFHKETVTRVKKLHTSDCLRANKSTMAWGLEARVPFLDKSFLDVAMTINPEEKVFREGRMEKYILRKAFDVSTTGDVRYLPDSILWRQKEQFSDGVGYGWIDSLKDAAEQHVTDEQLANAADRWPKDTPATKEAYWYREQFESWFPQEACIDSVERWIPRRDWGCPEDPSGRAQRVHNNAYNNDANV